MQETEEARPEEANTQESLNDTLPTEDASGAFDEPVPTEARTSPDEDDGWEETVVATEQLPNAPQQSDVLEQDTQEGVRPKQSFSSSVLYRFLVNRKLEDTSGIDEL